MSSLPNVIHFNCQSCGMLLTVPKEMAGVTGPCPHCRATITSPAAVPASLAVSVPGPSWPMAQNAISTPPAPVMTTQVPLAPPAAPAPLPQVQPQPSPLPQYQPPAYQQPQPLPQHQPLAPAEQPPLQLQHPTQAPLPAPVEVPAPVHTPSSTWEASNPPQTSPLPPAVGGGVMNPAWPPAGTELPPPSLPAPPGSPHPVMESVLQMPGVHQSQQNLLGQSASAPSPFPPSPPPRTSPLVSHGNAASQRFKSSRGYSGTRRGPAVLAVLMALMAMAGTAWFFRDQIRVAWTTHMAAREAEAEALEFHPTPLTPDEPAAPATAFDPSSPTSSQGQPAAPAPVASAGGGAVPAQSSAASGESPANPGTSPPEQVQRPPMAYNPPIPAPAAEPRSATQAPPPAPNLVEVPNPLPSPPGDTPANESPAPTRPTPQAPPTPVIAEVPAEAQPALDALQKFLTAPTWEERLKVVQGAEIMRPLMQSYYASMPDGPLHVAKIGLIRHDKAPQTGPPHCVFQIGGGDVKRPLPIMVEQSPEGWKVDWLTFTEFKDNLLARFMESPQEGPKRFHVLVRRTHYFDDNVPDLEKKICVEVQAPMPPFVGSVFANKGTPVANILDRYLGWQVDQAAAVVELEWRREGDQQWVELTNLPQFNWRNAIAGEVVPPPHAAPTTPVAVPARD